jgi:hypothetical protein
VTLRSIAEADRTVDPTHHRVADYVTPFDLAALLENVSAKGDASSTCMEPQGIVEDASPDAGGVM